MKILFDLFPVILFFATYKFASHDGHGASSCLAAAQAALPITQEPILLATLVAIVATVIQVGWLLLRKQKVDMMLWLSLTIIVVFGGATLYFRDPTFIQWKPTVLYWLFGTALLVAAILKKNLIQQMMEGQISLPPAVWSKLNGAWVIFFFIMGAANLTAVRLLSCDAWVSFKLYGLTALMLTFVIGQSLFLGKYIEEGKA